MGPSKMNTPDVIKCRSELRRSRRFEILLGTAGKKTAPALTASDLMHILLEIRSHINDMSKLCEIYARYPELLQELTLEALLFGQDIFLPIGYIKIPEIEPFLSNILFFLTYADQQALEFQYCFPGWDTIYLEEYTDENMGLYIQTTFMVFDMLHIRKSNNCYPLHMMISDLIASSSPTSLIHSNQLWHQ